jgi:small-conductance mechanosensitive channel
MVFDFQPQLIVAAAFILGGLALGWIFERIILLELKKLAHRTKWEGDRVLVAALHGIVVLAFLLAGLYGALLTAPTDESAFGLGQRAVAVAAILLATVALSRILTGFVNMYAGRVSGLLPSTSLFSNITRILVYVLGGLVVLAYLDISITPILTALGVGGLAVALALQDTLSNLFAGVHIIASRQIKIGDYVELESGQAGYVEDITWRNTTIRALANNMVVVPNAVLASAAITNYCQPMEELGVLMGVGVAYGSDLAKVETVTTEVAREVMREVEGGVPDFEPFIRYHTFGGSSIDFNVILRAKTFADQYVIRHEFIKRLHARYARDGIEIPFPIRTVYMAKETVES